MIESECDFETGACRSAQKASTFEKVIQRDRSVCEHCFRQIYEVDENWLPERARKSVKRMTKNVRYEGRKDNTEMVPDLKPYNTTRGETRSCNCGAVDFQPYNRPLKKAVFMEFAENLSQRLDERGEKHDEADFLHYCRELKDEGEMKDDMIFCEVTEELT